MSANKVRGDVEAKIGGVDLTIRVTMDGLCKFSSAIKAQTFSEVWNRAIGAEPNAVFAGLRLWTVKGDAEKALENMSLADFAVVSRAFGEALSAHAGDDPGNG